MNIALIAHDQKKPEMIEFAKKYEKKLMKHELFGTGTTGKKIMESTSLSVHRFLSGPYGGDQQIGAKIATGEMDLVIFFRDPLTAQPHEPDVSALMRLCDVHNIPLASNEAAATMMMEALDE
ncbi:methylglyoxal synthase [Beduini massiliensis]|uniref:methylglyoxal synthase n=1 Tax=Beduini massiliensis TaxID=1585974 RepID=UPI00059AAE7B|nr:methylglyoxal synthase [Beduini massiliensis]